MLTKIINNNLHGCAILLKFRELGQDCPPIYRFNEVFSAGGGSVSASSSEAVDNSSMVGSETTTAGVDRVKVSSKIG